MLERRAAMVYGVSPRRARSGVIHYVHDDSFDRDARERAMRDAGKTKNGEHVACETRFYRLRRRRRARVVVERW